jgi:flagellar biosynthesis protein FlhG
MRNKNGLEIWAVGGGKGGTGKSFFASLLGILLSSNGKKVILMDADYGGANLHSFMDIKKGRYTLTDFFDKKVPLKDIVLETYIPNLRLIPGDLYSFNPRGFTYMEKQKLFRHIKKLDADLVLMDLGAGAGSNIVDTFLLADRMIAVSTPQTISIDNLYRFMDRVLFRKVHTELDKHGLKSLAQEAWKRKGDIPLKTFREVAYYLSTFSDQIRLLLEKELRDFTIDIIMNHIRNSEELLAGFSLKDLMSSYYGVRVRYMGHVRYNESLWKHNNRFDSLFKTQPSIPTFREVEAIAHSLVQDEEIIETRQSLPEVLVYLVANTPRAVQAMNGRKFLEITRFPFRAGRLSSRRLENLLKHNDYYFRDEAPYSFSRAHFSIVEQGGGFYFQDRDSRFGTLVNSIKVGGDEGNLKEVPLCQGQNSVVFGRSPKELSFTILVKE